MALFDKWSLAQLRAVVQRELIDPQSQWWGTAELNNYIAEWQQVLQQHFEFVWGTATITNSLSTITLSNVASNMMRLDAIYFSPGTWTSTGSVVVIDTSTRRLSPRSLIDLDELQIDWRALSTTTGLQPEVSYQNDSYTVSFWPPPPTSGTYVFNYPVLTSFATDTDTMVVPAWTRYSCAAYCAYKAYIRFGPNQDIPKAKRRRMQWEKFMRKYRKFYDNYIPERSEMLRPGRKWAANILIPRQQNLQVP